MATVINNPERTERVIETSDNGGWAVAVIILIVVLVIAGFAWMYYHPATAANTTPATGSANINVTLPAGGSTDNSGTNGTTNTSGSANTAPAAQ